MSCSLFVALLSTTHADSLTPFCFCRFINTRAATAASNSLPLYSFTFKTPQILSGSNKTPCLVASLAGFQHVKGRHVVGSCKFQLILLWIFFLNRPLKFYYNTSSKFQVLTNLLDPFFLSLKLFLTLFLDYPLRITIQFTDSTSNRTTRG